MIANSDSIFNETFSLSLSIKICANLDLTLLMNFATETTSELIRLHNEIERGTRIISLGGLTSIASKAFILSNLQSETGKTFVVVTDSNKETETWEGDLSFWNEATTRQSDDATKSLGFSVSLSLRLLTLPSFESDIYANISPHAETLEQRALTLWKLTHSQPDFLILSAKSLITKTLTPNTIKKLGAKLRRDEDFAPENLIEKLVAGGYVREEPLKNIGEFSVRGGILDVWSPTAENPVRIEFFGDTVDSIREFDAETQLSIRQLPEIAIAPMREFTAVSQDFNDWAFFARERFADEKFKRALLDRTQFAEMGESFSGWEFLFPIVQPRDANIFDFLPDCVFVIDEPSVVEQSLSSFYETLHSRFAEITETGEIGLEPQELFLSGEQLREKFDKAKRIELRALGRTAAKTDEEF